MADRSRVAFGDMDADELWRMAERAIENRVASLKESLNKRTQTATIEEVRYLQGQVFALEDWLLNFPQREFQTIMQELRSTRGA